jgi:hypothetical protein
MGSAGSGNALVLLLEPVLLREYSVLLARSTLNFDRLCLVCLQVVRDVGLLGRCRCLWDGEGLDLALGVRGLDLRDLVVLELAEVQVLDQVGCGTDWVSYCRCSREEDESPERTAEGVMKVRRAT